MAFTLPALPYLKESLEPFIDLITMEIHHGKHHNAYVNNLNKAIENTDADKMSIEDILKNISKYPVAVRNNAGGHFNHSMFWTLLSPNGGGVPNGKLGNEIHSTFDSFDEFKKKFTESATGRFGSGWAWLIKNESGKLEICSTPNQDNPLMDIAEKKGIPLLGLDIWEHAYYLKYQNRRPEYIDAWWNLVNWNEASSRFSQVQQIEKKSTNKMKKNKNTFQNSPGKDEPPVKPEKDIPVKPDKNPDPTKPRPGGNEPEKNDPTRIEQPGKSDPTRIDEHPNKKKGLS